MTTTSRRALLKAAPAAATAVALPTVVVAQVADEDGRITGYTREEYEADCQSAREIAMLWVARAWVDRWKALGGDFGMRLNRQYQPESLTRGMICDPDLWTRTDRDRQDLPPHVRLVADYQHEGAVKALEGLLELAPDLAVAVREIGIREAMTRWAQGR
jgi:hypothetical protein